MFNFAHLWGGANASEDDEDEKAKGKKARARARRAEEDDDGADAEDDDNDDADAEEGDNDDPDAEDDDGDEKAKGKKAKGKKAQDDDEDDSVAKGRRMERRRCAAIFGSKHAAARPDLAAELAFNSSMSSSQAKNFLAKAARQAGASGNAASAGKTGRISLDARMSGMPQHQLGEDAPGPAAGSPEAIVAQMTSLYNSANGVK